MSKIWLLDICMGQAFFFRCIFFFLQSMPKKFQLYNVDKKNVFWEWSFVCTWTIQICYVGFNSTMRRHWMTFLVEKCNIGHFCIMNIFYAVFPFLVKIKSHFNIMIYDKIDAFQSFYLFFHYQIFFIRVNFYT